MSQKVERSVIFLPPGIIWTILDPFDVHELLFCVLHELLFCVRQDAALKLPYGHIACKGTSSIHELLFCVRQDAPWKLPHSQIACKGTSPLHELISCVG